LPTARRIPVEATSGVDEIDELAVALFHRGDEVEKANGFVADTRVSGCFIFPEIHDRGPRGVVETRDSLESIARGRSGRPIVGSFSVEGDDAYFSSANNGVQAEVLKVIEGDPRWSRTSRRCLRLRSATTGRTERGEKESRGRDEGP
jgi:hypothetical protein